MATLSAARSEASCWAKNCSFKNDSALPMALTLIPIVGPIIQIVKSISLNNEIIKSANDGDVDKVVELTKTRNKYHYFSMTRELLQLIAVVTMTVVGILNPIFGAIAAIVFAVLAGIYIYRIVANQNQIQDLTNNLNRPFHPITIR